MENSAQPVAPLPCPNPWCHSHDRSLPLTTIGIAEVPICHGRIGFRARCSDCGLYSPTVDRKVDAYPAWNTRSSTPPQPVEGQADDLQARHDLAVMGLKQAYGDLHLVICHGVMRPMWEAAVHAQKHVETVLQCLGEIKS